MNKRGIIQSVIDVIKDPEREFIERIYLALSIVSEITVFIARIGDIIIKENPYQLADDISGVGFKTADEIASKIGIRVDSEYRIRSGILKHPSHPGKSPWKC